MWVVLAALEAGEGHEGEVRLLGESPGREHYGGPLLGLPPVGSPSGLPPVSWRTSRSAAATPSAATAAPAKKAHLYPATSASSSGSPPTATASVRATATAKRTAKPRAVPTWAEEFKRPEASPRSSSFTADVPRVVEATAEQPRARPERVAFATTYQRPPLAEMPTSPSAMVRLAPKVPVSREPRMEPTTTERLQGNPKRPARVGE